MHEKPLSIIIPTYYEEKNLLGLLPYLKEHTLNKKVDITVCNAQDSADQAEAVCRRFGIRYRRSAGTQRSIQMNCGAQDAKGEILMFLHADVFPPTDFYEQIQQCIAAGNEAVFFSYRFEKSHPLLRINGFMTQYDGLFAGGGDQCQFMLKSTFEKLGGFDDHFVIMEDFELTRQMRKQDIPYQIIQSNAKVSARKYENNSYLRVNLVNLYVLMKFKMNTEPQELKRLYQRLLK